MDVSGQVLDCIPLLTLIGFSLIVSAALSRPLSSKLLGWGAPLFFLGVFFALFPLVSGPRKSSALLVPVAGESTAFYVYKVQSTFFIIILLSLCLFLVARRLRSLGEAEASMALKVIGICTLIVTGLFYLPVFRHPPLRYKADLGSIGGAVHPRTVLATLTGTSLDQFLFEYNHPWCAAYRRGNRKKAIDLVTKSIEEDRTLVCKGHKDLALLYEQEGRNDRAVPVWDQMVSLGCQTDPYYAYLARNRMFERLEGLYRSCQKHGGCDLVLATAYEAYGFRDRAESFYRANIGELLGFYERNSNTESLISYFQKMRDDRWKPNQGEYSTLAALLELHGYGPESDEVLEAARNSLTPDDPDYRFFMEDMKRCDNLIALHRLIRDRNLEEAERIYNDSPQLISGDLFYSDKIGYALLLSQVQKALGRSEDMTKTMEGIDRIKKFLQHNGEVCRFEF